MPPLIMFLRAVIDANALVYITVSDLLLGLVKRLLFFDLLWSEEILAETERTLIGKLGWRPEDVHRRLSAMCDFFPDATVSGFGRWLPQCTNDEHDRHVLAAAIEARANIIITYNERHFGPEHLARWGVHQMVPDDFLFLLYERAPLPVWEQLRVMAKRRNISVGNLLIRLRSGAPKFADQLLSELVE